MTVTENKDLAKDRQNLEYLQKLEKSIAQAERGEVVKRSMEEMQAMEAQVQPVKTKAQEQKEALKRLYNGLKVIDDEPFDDEFDALMKQRLDAGRELDI
jgi:hypothetical protein